MVLYAALITHGVLALWQVAMRRTLRMSLTQFVQLVLGILIPLQLIDHVVHASYANWAFDMRDDMSSLVLMMWSGPEALQQYLLLLAVWIPARPVEGAGSDSQCGRFSLYHHPTQHHLDRGEWVLPWKLPQKVQLSLKHPGSPGTHSCGAPVPHVL